jgi:hypothetical protein
MPRACLETDPKKPLYQYSKHVIIDKAGHRPPRFDLFAVGGCPQELESGHRNDRAWRALAMPG